MKVFSRRATIFIVFVVMIAGAFFVYKIKLFSSGIPQEFTSARLQGALVAQSIVNLSNQSVDDVGKINDLEKAGKYQEALNATEELSARSKEIRDQAVELSNQIGTMTKALSDIDSFEARQAALESISSRLALINRLISYSSYVDQLTDVLRDRFLGRPVRPGTVAILVDQINGEVRAINTFNGQAGQSMDRFDQILKGK